MAVTALHVALGGLLLFLTTRFLTFHATRLSAGLVGLALGTSWSFIYYKKVLGGTEILLQAAGVLFVWAMWSRRHSGGKHGATAIAVAVGLGIMAKITFAPVIAALGIATLLTRWDHQPLKPPRKLRVFRLATIVALITSPLTLAFLHHEFLAPEHVVVSHDYLDLQLNRAFGGLSTAPREGAENLLWFALDPIQWFGPSYSAEVPNFSPLGRGFGWLLITVGSFAAWRDRDSNRSGALLRFMSLAVPLEICALYLSNRDLHHLAQLSPQVAILLALSTERCAAMFTAPRSLKRAVLSLLLIFPWLQSGVSSLKVTDATISTSPIHTFTVRGQSSLVELVERNNVERLWSSDYDLYGVLDILLPTVDTNNAWGDISHRRGGHRVDGQTVKVCDIAGHDCPRAALQDLLSSARGAHYLIVRPSAPMIYNLKPNIHDLQHAASAAGVELLIVDYLEDESGRWAELISIL
jgi:4-amino-4-deoxy-L-arabinose transferase-like glycosyltransferase